MGFLELSFGLGGREVQHAEDACFALGASAVTLADAADTPVLEPALGEVRLWPATEVRALWPGDTPAEPLMAALVAALGLEASAIRAQAIADRAWEREWLKDFHAMRFGRRLWICPHHERVTDPEAVVVALDPGLAFGTGAHASTALCLTWLDEHARAGIRAIDYGCGSGVLALAAARLGAREVQCFDLDPQALLATAENAAANGLSGHVRVRAAATDLEGGVDLLLANILAGTLCTLASDFAHRVRPGGEVVLAGILNDEVPEVTAAYTPWFDVKRFGGREDWAALSGRRR
ncbi:MAG: 50S ribosomal protein L11 methyltransferase [Proteobacteria bacterium]|nr:50S ribosomal protein L11 methyltransferase [Pseudomonadota bacterium]